MKYTCQVEGDRIAKNTVEYTKALEELNKRRLPFTIWFSVGLVALGSLTGFLVQTDEPISRTLLSISTCVALVLSSAAIGECIRLRRQVNAVLVLMRKGATYPD